jgi:hypothetical protein
LISSGYGILASSKGGGFRWAAGVGLRAKAVVGVGLFCGLKPAANTDGQQQRHDQHRDPSLRSRMTGFWVGRSEPSGAGGVVGGEGGGSAG